MLFFFIRHGDPTYDPDKLTPLGHRQAEAIGRRLARYGLDEIYASSAVRARETAIPACELLKKEAVILDWAHENHAWDEMTLPDANGNPTWNFVAPGMKEFYMSREIRDLGMRWYDHPFFDEGNTIRQGYLRIYKEAKDFFAAQGFVYDDEKGMYKNTVNNEKRVALFAHHGFGTAFLSSVLEIPYPLVCEKMNFGHTGMTVIRFDTRDEYVVPQMLTMANDGHLLADNMPTGYNNKIFF